MAVPVPEVMDTTSYFYGEQLLASRTTLKLEDHPLSSVYDVLFYIFEVKLHNWRPSLPSPN
jgi:hypothetical protein